MHIQEYRRAWAPRRCKKEKRIFGIFSHILAPIGFGKSSIITEGVGGTVRATSTYVKYIRGKSAASRSDFRKKGKRRDFLARKKGRRQLILKLANAPSTQAARRRRKE
jgi:hypothetical protein